MTRSTRRRSTTTRQPGHRRHQALPLTYGPSAAAANLRITRVEQTAPDSATVAVAADATAAFVTLESLAVVGAFSGGAFTLLAGGTATVTFRAREHFSVDALRRGLRVRSLADTLTHASEASGAEAAARRLSRAPRRSWRD